MDERPKTTNTNDSIATLKPLLEAESTPSTSSHLAPTEKPNATFGQQSTSTNKWSQSLAQWGLEITALGLSLMAFGLMIYLLYRHWWTLIGSVLLVEELGEACVCFNLACVDPIGALIAIALLAFESFTQAVLAVKEVTLDHREYKKVGSTGVKEARQSLKPAFACATGNCTWDNFTSIAVCSKCYDISRYVARPSGPVKLPSKIEATGPYDQSWVLGHGETLPDVSNPSPYADWANDQNFTFFKHEIPEINISISNYNGSRQCRDSSRRCPDTYLVTTNPGRTLMFGNLSTILMAIQYLVANETWLDDKTTWENTKVSARECAISFCVNEYHNVLSQGILQETITSSWVDKEPESYTSDDKSVKAFLKYTNHSLDMCLQLAQLSYLQIKIPDGDYKRQASILRQEYFNITQTTIIALQNVLSDEFGQIRDLKSPHQDYIDGTSKKLLYIAWGMGQPATGFMSGLSRSNDIPATLDNVALSLTNWIRDRELQKSPMKGNATTTNYHTC
ncbi:hypothetical protein FACUT_9288 [Fusarium acutatum]|uniref:Uncharacterized protein n=1 Tax=Fusarium acutatum TaxID=78861 RepID=A0A8H4JIF4_9HYPO|nr:hypothetical protein FACUT_9288 [Fusarium acutatum]